VSEKRKDDTCDRRWIKETRIVYGAEKIECHHQLFEVGQRGQASSHLLRWNFRNTGRSKVGNLRGNYEK